MPLFMIVVGAALVVVGVGYWLGTGTSSVTALIPAFLGVALLSLGAWAHASEGPRTNIVRAGMVVALLGVVFPVIRLVKGGFDLTVPAQQAQALTVALSLVLLVGWLRA